MKTLCAALLFAVVTTLGAVAEETGFKMQNLVLYQKDEVLKARVKDVKALAEYADLLNKICIEYFAKEAKAETLHVVVALKPGKLSRVWFTSKTREDMKALAPLREKLEKVPAVDVTEGPVVLAITGDIAGGIKTEKAKDGEAFNPPIPKEWLDAIANSKEKKDGPLAVPEGFLAAVWPDEPGRETKGNAEPESFVTQELKPLGGDMLRPKSWFYIEKHAGHTLTWTISKEDSSKGEYITGMRIQLLVGVKGRSGKTAKEAIDGLVAEKKKKADKVIKEYEPTEIKGLGFTRVSIEVEEGTSHTLTSLFWSEGTDLAVISMTKAPKEEWKGMEPTFNKMSGFKLWDVEKLAEFLTKRKTGKEEKEKPDAEKEPEKK